MVRIDLPRDSFAVSLACIDFISNSKTITTLQVWNIVLLPYPFNCSLGRFV